VTRGDGIDACLRRGEDHARLGAIAGAEPLFEILRQPGSMRFAP
jgi:hypothetical protein